MVYPDFMLEIREESLNCNDQHLQSLDLKDNMDIVLVKFHDSHRSYASSVGFLRQEDYDINQKSEASKNSVQQTLRL